MKSKILGAALAWAWLLAPPSSGQTVAQLLQKGIYAQETAGDLDGAMRIYRQVLGAATELRAVAAQAQYRLAQCLLAKGDKTAAAKELEKLTREYPEQAELAKRAREGMPELAALIAVEYTHPRLPISFRLPPGWFVGTFSYRDTPAESLIQIRAPRSFPAVWVGLRETAPQDIWPSLRQYLIGKSRQRSSLWRVRPESIREFTVSGTPALSCIADMGEHGKVEYLVWIQTETAVALFFCTMLESEFEQARPAFDSFIDTIRLK